MTRMIGSRIFGVGAGSVIRGGKEFVVGRENDCKTGGACLTSDEARNAAAKIVRTNTGTAIIQGVSASECRATGRRHRGASPRCWTGTMRRASKVDVGLRGGSWHRNAELRGGEDSALSLGGKPAMLGAHAYVQWTDEDLWRAHLVFGGRAGIGRGRSGGFGGAQWGGEIDFVQDSVG